MHQGMLTRAMDEPIDGVGILVRVLVFRQQWREIAGFGWWFRRRHRLASSKRRRCP